MKFIVGGQQQALYWVQRNRVRRQRMRVMGELAMELAEALTDTSRVTRGALQSVMDQTVGKELKGALKTTGLRGRVLWVEVENPAILTMVRFRYAKPLLGAMKVRFGEKVVQDIRFTSSRCSSGAPVRP